MEETIKRKLYAARDYNKTLCLFEHKPERDEFLMCWKDLKSPAIYDEIEYERLGLFKNLEWDDEPVCVTITISEESENNRRYGKR